MPKHARRLQTAMQAFNLTRLNFHSPLRWFNEFDKRDRFCVKISILRDEEVDNYIAIIVQKSNPKLDDILRDFDEFIGFFGTKPE